MTEVAVLELAVIGTKIAHWTYPAVLLVEGVVVHPEGAVKEAVAQV
jgi:hypothetical protein